MVERVKNPELVDLAVSAGECPECQFRPRSSNGSEGRLMTEHMRNKHLIITGRAGNWRGKPTRHGDVIQGESIILGPVPTAPTKIVVKNGSAAREITVHIIPMSDIVDVIASGVRQLLAKKGLS